jgi:hypothetical protein
MERYVAGKPRFIVVTIGGQPGYSVFRLDGRWRDYNVTPVYNKIRTHRGAELVARKLAGGALASTNTRYYRTFDQSRLAKLQDGMRRRHDHAPAPEPVVPVGRPDAPPFPKFRSSLETAEILGISTKSVIRNFEGRDGVIDHGFSRTPTETDPRTKYRKLGISEEAIRQYISEHKSR